MQGRLSPPIDGFIQRFPMSSWQSEFYIASELGLKKIEWTVDFSTFYQHPIVDPSKYLETKGILEDSGIVANSVTCDFFMQANPFSSGKLEDLKGMFRSLFTSSSLSDGSILVVPLVDAGAPKSDADWVKAINFFKTLVQIMPERGLTIAFEMEVSPALQATFIRSLDSSHFGINFDMGNSAALGFDPSNEIYIIQEFIQNVHIKDRLLGGGTVPMGTGHTDFLKVGETLKAIGYEGDMILQCARQPLKSEKETISHYIDFCREVGLT